MGTRISIYLEDYLARDIQDALRTLKLPSAGAFVKKSIVDELNSLKRAAWREEAKFTANETTLELRKRGTSKFDAVRLVRSIRNEG